VSSHTSRAPITITTTFTSTTTFKPSSFSSPTDSFVSSSSIKTSSTDPSEVSSEPESPKDADQTSSCQDSLSSSPQSRCSTNSVASSRPRSVSSASSTGSDVTSVPERFLQAAGGDHKKALQNWTETFSFRQTYKLDDILTQPHPHFHSIKALYPHFYHKRSKRGYSVYYDAPGAMNVKMMENLQLTVNDLFWHYLYLSEFLWKEIDTSESAMVLSIIDLKGVAATDVANNGKVLEYIRRVSDCSRNHYPNRSYLIFMINVPMWFSFIWRHVISPLLDTQTRSRTHIHGSNYIQALSQHIDIEDIPMEYGGKCRCKGDCRFTSDIELALKSLVVKNNSKEGLKVSDISTKEIAS